MKKSILVTFLLLNLLPTPKDDNIKINKAFAAVRNTDNESVSFLYDKKNELPRKDSERDTISNQCSEGVRMLFKNLFGQLLDGMDCDANGMVRYLQNNPSIWHKINMSQAQDYANQGYLVIAGWINPNPNNSGHIVVVVPGTEYDSPLWGKVPMVMDTGYETRNAAQPLSHSFRWKEKKSIKFFVYK